MSHAYREYWLRWLSIEEFQQESNEGWCWIVYKGRVVEAYHDHNQIFRFSRHSDNCYMTECITWAMAWPAPVKPSIEEVTSD